MEYMKDRDRALRKATRTKDHSDKMKARRVRNITNVLIRNTKNSFIIQKNQNYIDNRKRFWEQIKQLCQLLVPTILLFCKIT